MIEQGKDKGCDHCLLKLVILKGRVKEQGSTSLEEVTEKSNVGKLLVNKAKRHLEMVEVVNVRDEDGVKVRLMSRQENHTLFAFREDVSHLIK